MIAYVCLGTNDLDRAAKFYDELFSVIGAKRVFEMESFIAWGKAPGQVSLAITRPFDQKEATVGNGVMVALAASSKEEVHAIYDKAIELGGTCEGPAGPRGDTFYAGYFRDPDGNKLNAFLITQ